MYLVSLQDPNTREYLQLALARVLELQREIREGIYIAETDNGSDQDNAKLFSYFIFFQALRDLLHLILPVIFATFYSGKKWRA